MNKKTKIILTVFFSLSFFLATQKVQAANYPLEIIQPRAGLDITNRFYKAYPGLEYNVRMAVIGGLYPYIYSLTTAPSGMTINSRTGEISWLNPIINASPYNVTAQVIDSESNIQTVSWTITVTNSGFLFVDAVNGKSIAEGGTGKEDNPWKSMKDIYGGDDYASKSISYHPGEFVYWKTGTYYLDAYIEDGTWVPFVGNYKPMVWLAYPGENPELDFKKEPYSIAFYSNGDNRIYIDGLTIKNMTSYGIQNNQTGTVYRRMTLYDLGPTDGFNNQSFFRLWAQGPQQNYIVIQDNMLHTLNHGAAIKVYSTTKMLIENNIIYDIIDTTGSGAIEGIALKQDVIRPTVRGNYIYNVPNHPIGGNMNSQAVSGGQYEILYNYIKNISGNSIELNQNSNVGSVDIYRNTLEGPINFYNTTDSADGPFNIGENIIIHNSGSAVDTSEVLDMSRVVILDNLTGTMTDSIELEGVLQESYMEYIGSRGWQLSDGLTPMELSGSTIGAPNSPTGLNVI
ncbi:MAG: Ig domain-containing protein [Candidatus Moraniibacteriota bacterium]